MGKRGGPEMGKRIPPTAGRQGRREQTPRLKSGDGVDENTLFAQDKVQANTNALYKVRVFVASTAGLLVGVCGISGLLGFVAYAVLAYAASVYIHFVIMRQSPSEYMLPSQSLWAPGGVLGGVVTFIIMWTLAYDSAYVF
eukprot:Hpha_TRINITY_DN11191_c0_g1::TRINITY_DN11191_c0_g1_i1::g.28262::m.28262